MKTVRVCVLCFLVSIVANAWAIFDLYDIYSEGTVLRYVEGGLGSDGSGTVQKHAGIHDYEFSGIATIEGEEYIALNVLTYDEEGNIKSRTPEAYYRIDGGKVYSYPSAEKCDNVAVDYPVFNFDVQPGELVMLRRGMINRSGLAAGDVQWAKCIERRNAL